jgi:hypothetical protein
MCAAQARQRREIVSLLTRFTCWVSELMRDDDDTGRAGLALALGADVPAIVVAGHRLP